MVRRTSRCELVEKAGRATAMRNILRRGIFYSVALFTLLGVFGVAQAFAQCGSRGGPGYRGPDGRCVPWNALDRICGVPPETRCTPERVNPDRRDEKKLQIRPPTAINAPSGSVAFIARPFAINSRWIACFTPGHDCTAEIVSAVTSIGANSELLVQAYGFTNDSIIKAIVEAKKRGAAVKVILDKSNEQPRYSGRITCLTNHSIDALLTDDKVAIAHNKVMVIDGRTVITGSFNFTKAAQDRNAENVLIVSDDPTLAATYAENWKQRAEASREYQPKQAVACPW